MTDTAPPPAPARDPARPARPPAREYDAFISYSHAADGQLAPQLQAGLQRLARRLFRPRALRVFRDRTGMGATPALWPTIQRALDGSRYLILMASPEAARSKWVPQEVEHWLAGPATADGPPAERLLIVLTDGEIAWDPASGGFAPGATTALPPVLLRGVFAAEPLWVDLRGARTQEDLSLQNPYFRGKVADLAATLHGRDKDELIGEDVRIARRTRRLAWTASLLLAVLAVTAGLAARAAVEQRDQARSRERAALAMAMLDVDPRESLRRAVEAVDVVETPEAVSALREALLRSLLRAELVPDSGRITAGTFAPRGTLVLTPVATADDRGYLQVWDGASGRPLCSVAGARNGRFTADGTRVVADDGRMVDARSCLPARGDTAAPGIPRVELEGEPFYTQSVRDLRTGAVILTLPDGQGPAGGANASPDGERIVVWPAKNLYTESGGSSSELEGKNAWIWKRGSPVEGPWELAGHHRAINHAAFGAEGGVVATGSDDRTARVWSPDGEAVAILRGHGAAVEHVAVRDDGARVLTVAADGRARLWEPPIRLPVPARFDDLFRLRYGVPLPRLQGPAQPVEVPVLTRDGRRVLARVGEVQVAAWDAATGQRVGPLLGGAGFLEPPAHGLAGDLGARVSPDGTRLLVPLGNRAVASGESFTLVLEVGTGRVMEFIPSTGVRPYTAAYSPDGSRLAIGEEGGTVQVRNAATLALDTVLNAGATRVLHVAFSGDGTRLVVSSRDAMARIWDLRTGRVTELFGHDTGVIHAFFSPDDALVVTVGEEDATRVWDAATGRLLGRVNGSVEPAFLSADCRTLVTGVAPMEEGDPPRVLLYPFGACGALDGMMALARRRI